MTVSTPTRRVERMRHELRSRDVQVLRVEPVGRSFVSVAFGGEALADFVSASFDDHVKFMFADVHGQTVRRDYTPRRFDRAQRELTIEFAMHGDGLASEWARRAVPGQRAVIGGPRGSMIIPVDYDWHLLVGDATALPAIHRRVEELPAGSRVIAIVQVADVADRRELLSASPLDIQWVSTPAELEAAVRAQAWPQGEGFVWCAGEASSMARLRAILLDDKQHPREAMRVAAYWKRGASGFHENL